jgi:2'-5' RNA ligase
VARNSNWRVFFALPIDSESREQLKLSLNHSEIALPPRATIPATWHITLAFIQAIEQSKVEKLIHRASAQTWPEPFVLTLDHLGAFPSGQRAEVLWCGTSEGSSRVEELASELSRMLHEFGLPTARRFSLGHLTLSRLPRPQDVTSLLPKPMRPVRLHVPRFVLFRSDPELGLEYYEELASFNLARRELA